MATLLVVSDMAEPASIGRGGLSMYVLQWLHGLERAGHRVVFLEFLKRDPGARRTAVVSYFEQTMSRWWRPNLAALLVATTGESLAGLDAVAIEYIAGAADAVLMIAAPYRAEPLPFLERVRPRILIEQDPAYTHLWAAGGDPREIFGDHDLYFTVGANIGAVNCAVPTLGIPWLPIWNPVVLDWWNPQKPVTRDRFTTIAEWRSYGYLEFEGKVLGPKAEEFLKFLALPRQAGEPFEIALNIDPDDPDLALLREHGWRIENPELVASPEMYKDYVESSRGEFSCAKGGYVDTRCGWFSDRSACYLAAGRPVVVQATGFEDLLPTGRGLFAVRTAAEASEAVQAIRRDFALHSAAARALAAEHFDAVRIAQRVLDEAGIGGAVSCIPCS